MKTFLAINLILIIENGKYSLHVAMLPFTLMIYQFIYDILTQGCVCDPGNP